MRLKDKVMQPIDKFGKLIVEKLRDQSLEYLQGIFDKKWKAPDLQPLQNKVSNLNPDLKALVFELAVDLLTHAMHDFLFAIQECHDGEMGIEVVVDGQQIAKQSDGLHAEIFGDGGWIVRFSKFPADKEIARSLQAESFVKEMLEKQAKKDDAQ